MLRYFSAFLILVSFFLTGCQGALNDENRKAEPIVLSGPETNCLAKTLETIKKYPKGEVDEMQVGAAWDCLNGALKLFMKNVSGSASRDYYTSDELKSFLERYFLTDIKISDRLMTEAMRFKQIFLGGGLEIITRSELERTEVVFNLLKVESIRILPFIQVYAVPDFQARRKVESSRVEAAVVQLTQSAENIGKLLGGTKSAYLLSYARDFLIEFGKLYDSSGGWQGPKWLADHIGVVASAKAFFVRPDGNVIYPEDWPDLMRSACRLYGLWLRYHYFIENKDLKTGSALDQLVDAVYEAFSLLDQSAKMKVNRVIEMRQLEDLILGLKEIGFFSTEIQDQTISGLLKTIFGKIYNPSINGQREKFAGITPAVLSLMKKDLLGWAEMQQLWDVVVAKTGTNEMPMSQFLEVWNTLTPNNVDAYKDFAVLLNSKHPVSLLADGQVAFVADIKSMMMNSDTFSGLNWRRAFLSLAMRGYAADSAGSRENGITKNEFKEFYTDLNPIAVELKFLAPDSANGWDSTFDEANVFLLSSDGNDRLGFAEGVEILSFALSGSQLSGKVFEDMSKKCKHFADDNMGKAMLESACVKAQIRQNFNTYFAALPGWVNMTADYKDDAWLMFLDAFERAARPKGFNANDPWESANLTKGIAIMYYVESVFARFDLNASNKLTQAEAKLAFPLIRPILAKVSGYTTDDWLYPIYTYLMRYGESPEASFTSKIQFLWWKANSSSWQFAANRYRLVKILANLK